MTQPATRSPEAIRGLAVEAAAGSREALGELYDEYAGPLWQHLYARTGSRSLADDLSHDAWEKVMARITTFDVERAQFVTWLYSVAGSVLATHARREGGNRRLREVRAHLLDFGRGEASLALGPDDLAVKGDDARRLVEALRSLPPRARKAVVLTHLEGLSQHEAAEILGVSENTFKQIKFRAMKALRAALPEVPRNQDDASRVYMSTGDTVADRSPNRVS